MTQDAHAGHGDCSEVLHRIYEYLDGEMSPDDVRRVAAHLVGAGGAVERVEAPRRDRADHEPHLGRRELDVAAAAGTGSGAECGADCEARAARCSRS